MREHVWMLDLMLLRGRRRRHIVAMVLLVPLLLLYPKNLFPFLDLFGKHAVLLLYGLLLSLELIDGVVHKLVLSRADVLKSCVKLLLQILELLRAHCLQVFPKIVSLVSLQKVNLSLKPVILHRPVRIDVGLRCNKLSLCVRVPLIAFKYLLHTLGKELLSAPHALQQLLVLEPCDSLHT